ncbi:MAG: alanine--tRNA ligase [Planctomycetes bacterium]|nr:alanine--tRNA ligase [Planctomycetota bacterium]
MNSSQIRHAFLDFYKSNGHQIINSSSLVPEGDNTLLFANAGMNQFKGLFTGEEKSQMTRATSSQKCVRAGGKHNDLENVGVTARHHTFFEMLGNFSFGNYFKKEAIDFAWTFLTEIIKLEKDKLWITIHDSDDEAGKLWQEATDYPMERIVKMGDKDNFWSMGETGPCGPCSEIHFDQGSSVGCGRSECDLYCDCDRYLEIWNLVFMQYEQKADGSRSPLPNPCIDTGMGLERISAVHQGFTSNYDTDLFMPIINKVAEITGVAYNTNETGVSHRILADHVKASTFLISDGIFPSNEGRGYVLRRIMRRAIRNSYLLGMRDVILPQLIETVIDMYQEAYPELLKRKDSILKMAEKEERGFLKTIAKGLNLFDNQKKDWQEDKTVPGEAAFKLYDTYGFPLDLTELMAEQEGLKIDEEGFKDCMAEQRKKAQAASMFKTSQLAGLHWKEHKDGEQSFSGYEKLSTSSVILRSATTEAGQILLVPEDCAFYAESGGQVGDRGSVSIKGNDVPVVDTQLVEGYHTLVLSADWNQLPEDGESLSQQVDQQARGLTRANHSCTHLLHKALKEFLGDHAEQRGSWVGPTHLRFDFPHSEAVDSVTLNKIEARVNELIQQDLAISTRLTSLDQAKEDGATALFGEKYSGDVRVVSMADQSMELCGGTHLASTGQALAFVIKSESSIASGIRRIEAITGSEAMAHLFEQRQYLKGITAKLQSQAHESEERLDILIKENQAGKKSLAALRQQMVMSQLDEKLKNPLQVGEQAYLAEIIEDMEAGDLRKTADNVRNRMSNLPFLLAATSEGKVALILSFPKAWVKEKGVNAGKSLKPLAKHIQGGGGGSPEMAQAGGKNPDGLSEVLKGFKELLAETSS